MEIVSKQSLYEFYGGGYEIVSLQGGEFKKLNDVTYLFWYVDLLDKGLGFAPDRAFKYHYDGDVLLIRTEAFELFEEVEGVLSSESSLNIVPPIYRHIQSPELDHLVLPNMSSKWICNYFIMPHPVRGTMVYVKANYSPEDEAPIRFIPHGKNILFAVERDFMKIVAEEIKMFRRSA